MVTNNRTKFNSKPLSEVPKKIYYSISEASEYTGVESHVLRYWETKFSKLNPKRVGGNQRKYTRNDLKLLYEIVHLLYKEGYTLDGAERKLRAGVQTVKAERKAKQEKQPPAEKPSGATPETSEPSPQPEAPPPQTASVVQPGVLREIKDELQSILKLLD